MTATSRPVKFIDQNGQLLAATLWAADLPRVGETIYFRWVELGVDGIDKSPIKFGIVTHIDHEIRIISFMDRGEMRYDANMPEVVIHLDTGQQPKEHEYG